jgi:hypothetical protein
MRLWPTKRRWKRLGIGLAILVAVALIINGLLAWRAEWRLSGRLAAIRAAGDPASIAELAPEPIPDDDNAAVILLRIQPRLTQFHNEYSQFHNTSFGQEYEKTQDRGEPPTKPQIDAIRVILSKYPDVLQALEQAAQRDRYASQLDFSLNHTNFIAAVMNQQSNARAPARLLGWRGEVLLADGQNEQAVECGLLALRLARMHENEPTLVAYLVAIAMRGIATAQLYDALAAGPVSPEMHAALDEELARQDDPLRLVQVLKTERAVSADWVYGNLSGGYRILAQILGWPMKLFQVGVLDVMNEYVQLAARPWHEVRGKFGLADTPSPATGHGVMADLLMPAVRAVFRAHARSLAVSRALRIHNSMRAFAEKNGREATGLDELDLPEQATIDPYSGQPLKLKRSDDGWVIYSVMEDGDDDGGDFKGLKDYGVAPRKLRLTE